MALFLPTLAVARVIDITPDLLRAVGVHGLILDVDNTLAEHGSPQPYHGTMEWLHRMSEAGIALVILSNNTQERVAPLARQYGIPFLSMCMKPLPFAYWRGAQLLGLSRKNMAVVGDQVFTDVLGANLSGMRSVLLEPIREEKSLSFRIRRRMEKRIRKRIRKKGLTPEKFLKQ